MTDAPTVAARPGSIATGGDQARLHRATVVIMATALASLFLNGAAGLWGPAPLQTMALVSTAVVPLLYAVFWLVSALLIDAGAQAMGAASQRRGLLTATASTYPILLTYPALTLAQILLVHAGAADLAGTVGWLALPALAWFVARSIAAIMTTYDMAALNALSLAFLPYALVTTVLLCLIVIVTILHGVGLI